MSPKHSKPKLSHTQVSELVRRLYGLHVTSSHIRPLDSFGDQNFYVRPHGGGEYVLKVMNSVDSQNPTLLGVQTHAMDFLRQRGLPAQTALPTLGGQLMSLQEMDCGFGAQKYLVRLLTYLPGTLVAKVPGTPQVLYEVGRMAATMDQALQEMEHPKLRALEMENFIWNLSSIPLLEQYLHVMDGDPLQQVVKDVMYKYKSEVEPKQTLFRKCINHGDFNDQNILLEPDGPSNYKISGILDFGDMSYGYYIFELAITIMYMMIESPNPVDVGGHVLAGWESVIPLNQAERDALYLLVLGRFCQSLVLSRHAVLQHPGNEEYLMSTAKTRTRLLSTLFKLGKEELQRRWFSTAMLYCSSVPKH